MLKNKNETHKFRDTHRKTDISQEARFCYRLYYIYKESIQFKTHNEITARESNLPSQHPTVVLKCLNNFSRRFVSSAVNRDTVAFIPFSLTSGYQCLTYGWGPEHNMLIISKVVTFVFYVKTLKTPVKVHTPLDKFDISYKEPWHLTSPSCCFCSGFCLLYLISVGFNLF